MADGETTYRDYILDLCEKRDDELGRIVRDQILGIPSDLHPKCNAIFHRSIHRANKSDDKCEVDGSFTQTVRIVGNARSKVWNCFDVEVV